MAIMPIVQLFRNNLNCKGSCLKTASNEVNVNEIKEDWFITFISDMFESLYANSTGVGLAANQVGILLKVCIIAKRGRLNDLSKSLVLINPKYTPINDEKEESEEVCLSFPDTKVKILRYKNINVEYVDFHGERCSIMPEGFLSIVLQHEIDHLYGINHVDLAQSTEDILEYTGSASKLAKETMEAITRVDLN